MTLLVFEECLDQHILADRTLRAAADVARAVKLDGMEH